ncbi:MAG: hypothetical protein ACYDBQ_05645 [Thermoplasmatota archaeon]
MQPREIRLLLEAARSWDREGLLVPGAAATLEARYRVPEGTETAPGLQAIYAAGGAVLGAAAIAAVTLSHLDSQPAGWTALGLASAAAVAGLALLWTKPRLAGIGDALLVAALVAAVYAAGVGSVCVFCGTSSYSAIPWLALALTVAILVLPWKRPLAPPFAAAAAVLTLALSLMNIFRGNSGVAGTSWLLAGTLALGALVAALGVAYRLPWMSAALAVVTFALVFVVWAFSDQTLQLHSQGQATLVSGALQAALVALTILIRDRVWLVGACLGVSTAAIVYSFQVGGPVLAVVVLVLVGGGLVGLGFALRRRA